MLNYPCKVKAPFDTSLGTDYLAACLKIPGELAYTLNLCRGANTSMTSNNLAVTFYRTYSLQHKDSMEVCWVKAHLLSRHRPV